MTSLTTVSIDDAAAHALVRTMLREVAAPQGQAHLTRTHLELTLPRTGRRIRAHLQRSSTTDNHRFCGPVQQLDGAEWHSLAATVLAELIADELHLATGERNDEFTVQTQQSLSGMTRGLQALLDRAHEPIVGSRARYLASEQSLWAGHRWHPTPKSRDEDERTWAAYAPESAPRIALRWLSIPQESRVGADSRGGAATTVQALAGAPDAGSARVAHPVHPWQWERLRETDEIRRLLRSGAIRDLGALSEDHDPTSSVRTLLGPRHFVKFSLGVRITNCVRTHAPCELTGAVHMSDLLSPAVEALEQAHPRVRLMRETGWRSVRFDDVDLVSGLGLIVREGWEDVLEPGVTPLLAAALAAEHTGAPAHLTSLIERDDALAWWDAYLRLLVPFVIESYAEYGIVSEPHLQNVVVGVDDEGMPAQVFLRDLEGVKLLPRWQSRLTHLDALSAARMSYDDQRGWQRTAYCLLVNNLSEFAAVLADLGCDELDVWDRVGDVLCELRDGSNRHEIDALLSGVPVPAKTNLLVRWSRRPDRDAGYVPVRLPLSIAASESVSA